MFCCIRFQVTQWACWVTLSTTIIFLNFQHVSVSDMIIMTNFGSNLLMQFFSEILLYLINRNLVLLSTSLLNYMRDVSRILCAFQPRALRVHVSNLRRVLHAVVFYKHCVLCTLVSNWLSCFMCVMSDVLSYLMCLLLCMLLCLICLVPYVLFLVPQLFRFSRAQHTPFRFISCSSAVSCILCFCFFSLAI